MSSTTENELSLTDTAELLTEIQSELRQQAPELCDFAGLLRQLIAISLSSEQDDAALSGLIQSGFTELRGLIENDSSDFQSLEKLRENAVENWGEQLAESADSDGDDWSFGEANAEIESSNDAEQAEVEAALPAPSAEEVQALLSQLGGQAAPMLPEAERDIPERAPVAPAATSPEPSQTSAPVDVFAGIESIIPELQEAFVADAESCLGSMENALLRLEEHPKDKASLQQILRELHTLKGASASIGLSSLADHIHDIEEGLREDEQAGRTPSIDKLLGCVDQIRNEVTRIQSPSHVESTNLLPPGAAHSSLQVTASPTSETPTPAAAIHFTDDASDDETVRVKASQLNRLMDMLAELVTLRNQRESEIAELQNVYHELITSVSQMRLLRSETDIIHSQSTSLQISEVANDVLEAAQGLKNCVRPFADANSSVSRFIGQFRQELVQLRRTPISGLFRRLQRVVRDAGQAEDKQVKLELIGQDAGIERSLQQNLYEPLLHIVRNSVCHGIEDAETRESQGKPAEGRISLTAQSGPDLFAIEIRDDGRGLDYEAIRRRGIERGLLAADHAASREELSQLIFQPGFSTRDSASQVAGRGVGMDVVAATLEKMRGWLEVQSEPGKGTTIRLSFPLPSVIQHAMVFRSAGQLFALPMESVQAAGEVNPEIPQANFAGLLGLPGEPKDTDHAIVIANDQNGNVTPIALYVDELVGPEELVVRPLPGLLRNHPFCVGATLSGMGQAVLLLDARRVLQAQSETRPEHRPQKGRLTPQRRKLPRVLVVDDSLSARKRVVRSLSRFALDIVEATNGQEAVELIKQENFTAVFSDMEMPHLDGMGLLEQVSAVRKEKAPPVVIISSRCEREFTDRARELGAKDYLIKPLEDSDMDSALTRLEPLRHLLQDSQSV